jgi:hypothetical protein
MVQCKGTNWQKLAWGDYMPDLSQPIAWEARYEDALKKARAERREVLIYFHKPN